MLKIPLKTLKHEPTKTEVARIGSIVKMKVTPIVDGQQNKKWHIKQLHHRLSISQFGFKKGRGCTHTIYACRKIIDHFVNSGSTVNLCTLDLSNAFDKVNHHALFLKLMQRRVPAVLLTLLENLLLHCYSCVK